MDRNNGTTNKFRQDVEKNKLQPQSPEKVLQESGLSGVQFYEPQAFIEPLIDIENNYAKYMGAAKVLLQENEADLREIRAQNQSFLETASRGVARGVLKTGLHAVGGLTTPLALIISGGKFDNEWNKLIDDAVEGVDELMPIYKTKAQQDASFFSAENLLSDNFWFDDVIGMTSFVAGSYLSGMGLGALGRSMQITQRLMKSSKKLKQAVDATKVAELMARRMKYINLGQLGVQTTMSAYEAGMQARQFKEVALEELKQEHMLQFAKPPTAEELQQYHRDVNKIANGVFAINIALVTTENVVMLNKIYGKPFKQIIPERVRRGVGGIGEYFDPRTTAPTRFAHVVKSLYKTAWQPLFEGFQEFAQGFINEAAIEYLMGKYSPEGHNENYKLGMAVYDSFQKIKGKEDAYNEAYMGMLMGLLGIPGVATGSVKHIPEIFSKPKMGQIATAYNAYSQEDSANIMKNSAMHMARVFETNKNLEKAVRDGDIFLAKNEEAKQLLSWMSSRYNSNMLDAEIDNYNDSLEKMSDEEFMEQFGYQGLSKSEIRERKNYLKQSLLDKKAAFIKAKQLADKITLVDDNGDVNELITYNVFMNEDAKRRIDEIEKQVYENTGLRISINRELSEESDLELGKYFEFTGSVKSNAPPKLKEYLEDPGNWANLVVSVADHKRLIDERTNYTTAIKSLYDIDNQRKIIKMVGYMKYGLFYKFGRSGDIANTNIKEYIQLQQVVKELEEEAKLYKDEFPDIHLEILNEIDYVKGRMEDLKTKVEKKFMPFYQKESQRLKDLKTKLEIEAEGYKDTNPAMYTNTMSELDKVNKKIEKLNEDMDGKLAEFEKTTGERLFNVRHLIDLMIPDREIYKDTFDPYKKMKRPPLVSSRPAPRYDGDPENDDKIFPPPGSTVGLIVRDKNTKRPIFYSFITYNQKNEDVTEQYITRTNDDTNNTFSEEPYNKMYNAFRKALEEELTKGLTARQKKRFNIDKFLLENYGITEDNFYGLKKKVTSIKDGNSVMFHVEKYTDSIDPETGLKERENVVIATSNNFFSKTSGLEARIREMFNLRNMHNKDAKVIVRDDFTLMTHDDKTFEDSDFDLDFGEYMEIDTASGTSLKEVGGKIQVPIVIVGIDPVTKKTVVKKRGMVFFKTTNFKGKSKSPFSKAEKIKRDAMNKYEETMEKLRKIKEKLDRMKKGFGDSNAKVGEEATECK